MNKSLLVVILLLAALLIPFSSLDAPDWTVSVVYGPNEPAGGVLVREEYQNYSVEKQEHEVDLLTDASGKVHFPAKRHYRNCLIRIWGVLNAATGGVHASFGPHDYVLAFGDGFEGIPEKNGFEEDWTGSPAHVDSLILLHPVQQQLNNTR